MIRINPRPEEENLSDEKIFRVLKDVCKARNEQRVSELRNLLAILWGKE